MRRRLVLFVAMIAAVALVGVTLYLDARREAAAALADFAGEQVTLADIVANQLGDAPFEGVTTIEQPGSLVVVADAHGVLRRKDGAMVASEVLSTAVARGERTVRFSRPEAAALGLPERTAMAGIAHTKQGRAVAVIATAVRVRDREIRAQNRLLLGIILAALLVGSFGGVALQIQRKEYLLERELLVRHAETVSEERLARADKLATMGAFATGIAHEIATPLGVISARAETLAPRLAGDERSARALQTIQGQTEKIKDIIKTFLALARGETPTGTRIPSAELLRSAARMVEHRYTAANVALDLDVGDAPEVFGEPRLLEQALVNLLLNACEASEAGQHVNARLRAHETTVSFRVEDEGVGIAPEIAARATEPFFTTKQSGTGLGLAIVNEIAKHHRGELVIEPREVRGTVARLELPAASDATTKKERAA